MSTDKTIPDSQMAEIKKNFEFFDRDKNGEIDIKEFTELLKILSPKSKNEHAEQGFSLIDSNGDGHIDFDEFLGWWKTCWWEY